MILRPILISASALSRHSGPHLSYLPNAVKQRPQRLTPLTFGVAALALSLGVGLVHLDSDALLNKETTVGEYSLYYLMPSQPNPVQSIRLHLLNSRPPCEYRSRAPFRNSH
jgi:hypothetical protein